MYVGLQTENAGLTGPAFFLRHISPLKPKLGLRGPAVELRSAWTGQTVPPRKYCLRHLGRHYYRWRFLAALLEFDEDLAGNFLEGLEDALTMKCNRF